MKLYGGVEAGGTKWVCAVGDGPDGLRELVTFPTTTPDETLGRAAAFFAGHTDLAAVGVGSFGPIDREAGRITTTPKPGWADIDVVAPLARSLQVPVAFDTDVNAAALGEGRWGAAEGLHTFWYITVGTGIGGGLVADGRLVHGVVHPEIGHMRIPHDPARDPFAGVCPFHGDCFEGLASGNAIRARWGSPGEELAADARVWELEAEYLAYGVVNVVCAASPQCVILGGGVMKEPALLPLVRARVRELLAGYVSEPEIVLPALGDRSGVLGAIELACSIATRS
ncbi:MAG: ROK family protein [Thermoleophilia bacterium]|nr:ROK family protein [Thermoleophilia bacterium]